MNLSFFRLFIIRSLGTDGEWKREWAYAGGPVIVLPSPADMGWQTSVCFSESETRWEDAGLLAWRCRGVRPGEVAAVCTHSEAASRLHRHPLARCWERAPPTPTWTGSRKEPACRAKSRVQVYVQPPDLVAGRAAGAHVLNVKCGRLA